MEPAARSGLVAGPSPGGHDFPREYVVASGAGIGELAAPRGRQGLCRLDGANLATLAALHNGDPDRLALRQRAQACSLHD